MKTGQPIIGRPAWYDRNPTIQEGKYVAASVAPHAQEPRWTYTVPAGKKAFVELAFLRIYRRTAATTVGIWAADIYYQPSGGSSTSHMRISSLDNTVGSEKTLTIGQNMIMLAGDALRGYTEDASTGGTCDYAVIAKITEFDA